MITSHAKTIHWGFIRLIRWFLKVSIEEIPLMRLGRLFHRLQAADVAQKKAYKYNLANGTSTLLTSDLVIMVDDVVVVGEVMSPSAI